MRFFRNFSATATGAAYQAGQAGYAVAAPATAAAAAATYGTQRAAGYDTAYQAAAATQGTYAAVGTGATPAYEYGYGKRNKIGGSRFIGASLCRTNGRRRIYGGLRPDRRRSQTGHLCRYVHSEGGRTTTSTSSGKWGSHEKNVTLIVLVTTFNFTYSHTTQRKC